MNSVENVLKSFSMLFVFCVFHDFKCTSCYELPVIKVYHSIVICFWNGVEFSCGTVIGPFEINYFICSVTFKVNVVCC